MTELMIKLLEKAEMVTELANKEAPLSFDEKEELRVSAIDCAAYVKFKVNHENKVKSDE